MNCPNCSQTIPDGSKFCGHCGKRLSQPAASPPKPTPQAEPATRTAFMESLPVNAPAPSTRTDEEARHERPTEVEVPSALLEARREPLPSVVLASAEQRAVEGGLLRKGASLLKDDREAEARREV
ncbi:zinc ribbon domain-containing protein, partial [Myxococcota bacterium]|nr:zinc ribbon domain-containing protein [Myxococcota bacterium]